MTLKSKETCLEYVDQNRKKKKEKIIWSWWQNRIIIDNRVNKKNSCRLTSIWNVYKENKKQHPLLHTHKKKKQKQSKINSTSRSKTIALRDGYFQAGIGLETSELL